MKKIIIFGGGGHANSCIDVIISEKKFKIAGVILDREDSKNGTSFPTISQSSDLKPILKITKNALVAIGMIKNYKIRLEVFKNAKNHGFNFPVIVSPISYLAKSALIKEGSIVMHGAVINAKAKIGYNTIINTKSLVEHDVVIGNNCHLSTGSIINGEVSVGDNTFVGSGSILKNGISIGSNCIIQAGSFLDKSIPDNTVYKNEKK